MQIKHLTLNTFKTMKEKDPLINILAAYPGRYPSGITIILRDSVGEYGLQTGNFQDLSFGVTVKEFYNEFRTTAVIDALGLANANDLVSDTMHNYLTTVIDKFMGKYTKNPQNAKLILPEFTTDSIRCLGNYYAVSMEFKLYNSLEVYAKKIHAFMDCLRHLVIQAINNTSGDDDYYDYVPSYVDMYRQACQIFHLSNEYNSFAAEVQKEYPDFYEESLYEKEIL